MNWLAWCSNFSIKSIFKEEEVPRTKDQGPRTKDLPMKLRLFLCFSRVLRTEFFQYIRTSLKVGDLVSSFRSVYCIFNIWPQSRWIRQWPLRHANNKMKEWYNRLLFVDCVLLCGFYGGVMLMYVLQVPRDGYYYRTRVPKYQVTVQYSTTYIRTRGLLVMGSWDLIPIRMGWG